MTPSAPGKRTSFLRGSPLSVDFSLQLTSLVDVFLLLLLFLLRGYADGLAGSAPATITRLPTVAEAGSASLPDVPRVELVANGVLLDGVAVAKAAGYRLDDKERLRFANALGVARRRDSVSARESRAALLADAEAPSDAVSSLAGLLATQGYAQLKLVVIQGR